MSPHAFHEAVPADIQRITRLTLAGGRAAEEIGANAIDAPVEDSSGAVEEQVAATAAAYQSSGQDAGHDIEYARLNPKKKKKTLLGIQVDDD